MENLKFRLLKSNEIDVRIGTMKLEDPKDKYSRVLGASYLLYKDARVDMNLLDEFVGNMNWQRQHEFKDGKLYCAVGIRNVKPDGFSDWVWKEDVGTESREEAEKGQASDAFKRACFNWGIGRELYTAPFIWIKPKSNEDLRKTKMFVDTIEYNDNNEINSLVIVDEDGEIRYSLNAPKTQQPPKPKKEKKVVEEPKVDFKREAAVAELNGLGITLQQVADYLGKAPEALTTEEIKSIIERKVKQNAKRKN